LIRHAGRFLATIPSLPVAMIQSSVLCLPIPAVGFALVLQTSLCPTWIAAVLMSTIAALADVKDGLAQTTLALP
jgi:hypothetical protein